MLAIAVAGSAMAVQDGGDMAPCKAGAAATGWAAGGDVPRAAPPPGRQDPMYYPWSERASQNGASPPELLLRELRDLQSASQHDRAMLVADELVRAAPDHPVAHYNHACALAQLRRADLAFAALDRAVELGWRNLLHTRLDLDLQPLRHDARWVALLQRLHALRVAERLEPTPIRNGPWTDIATDLEREIPDLLERHRVPGAVVAVIRDGEVVWREAFGMRHRVRAEAMTPDSRFALGASRQLVTVAAVLEEQRQGRLELDQVVALLDESIPAARSSGPGPVAVRLPAHGPARLTARPTRNRDPYALIQMLVELSSQQSFQEYWRRWMPKATSLTDEASAALATGHTVFGTPFPTEGGAGRSITADELGRLAGTVMQSFGSGVDARLAAGLLEEMSRLERSGSVDLGLALRAAPTPAGPQLRIDEERRGVGCVVRGYPERGCGVVVLYNGENGGEAARRIAHLTLGGWE